MRGWFDAFRHDGGPTLYDHTNRTAVTGDVPTITLCVVFITLFVAFLIIFPGIRKERLTTFITVTLSLFTGAVILVSNFGTEWHVADKQITSAYRAFSSEKIVADLGVHIGFTNVNISLKSVSTLNSSERIDFNERFGWDGPSQMAEEYEHALHKGLPYPILTVAEYLSLDEEGFCWGRIYRSAGYYCGICLWSAFGSWMLMNILLVVVPRYGAYSMILTGGLMVLTNVLYFMLVPSRPLVIRFEDAIVSFRFGWCYWLVLFAGVICAITGMIISIVDVIYPHKFSTILELDYDTPYDRHIIIEESHDTKRKKPRLEEPFTAGFSSKIFRRFSRRGENGENKYGIDNPALEIDPPKSPWRYPHRTFNVPVRTESRKSTKSVNFRDQKTYGNTLHPSSASISPSMEMVNVESLPELHANITDNTKKRDSEQWNDDSDSDDGQIERVTTIPIPTVISVDFQSQFRNSLLGVKRQDSQNSRRSHSSSRLSARMSRNERQYDNEWKSRENNISHSPTGSGSSTPKRKVSSDDDDIQIDRSDNHQRSNLATISARISNGFDGERYVRESGNDDLDADMW